MKWQHFFTNDEKLEHVNEFVYLTGGRKMDGEILRHKVRWLTCSLLQEIMLLHHFIYGSESGVFRRNININ